MFRTVLVCALSFGIAQSVLAQPQPVPKDGKLIIPLTVTPAAMPRLKTTVLLTPQYTEMELGNKVYSFMKSYMEQQNFFSKEPSEQRYKWSVMRLEDLPIAEMKAQGIMGGRAYWNKPKSLLDATGRPLSDVDEGARLRTTDWQEWFNFRRDGMVMLVPEVQKMRELAAVLQLRARGEVKLREFDKAIYSFGTFQGLALAFNEHPTLVGSLVGMAIQSLGLSVVEEFIAQPGSPNLYWGLVDLQQNLVNLKFAVQGERLIVSEFTKTIMDAKKPMEDAEFGDFAKEVTAFSGLGNGNASTNVSPGLRYAILSKSQEHLAECRKLLIETGYSEDLVKKYKPLQLVIMADIRWYEVYREEFCKFVNLPYWEAKVGLQEIEDELKKHRDQLILAPALLPALNKIVNSQARLKQTVSYLQTIEAIRWYASVHQKLPAKLSDIKLSLPLDPINGKPFEYSVQDGVGILHGESPIPESPMMNKYYHITLKNMK
jgi:hypothetical protein